MSFRSLRAQEGVGWQRRRPAEASLQIWVPDVDSISCITDPRCIAKDHYVPPLEARDLSAGVPNEERGMINIWQIVSVDYVGALFTICLRFDRLASEVVDEQWGARPKHIANSDTYFGPNTVEGWSFQPLGHEWIATYVQGLHRAGAITTRCTLSVCWLDSQETRWKCRIADEQTLASARWSLPPCILH